MANTRKRALYVITKSVWGGAQRYVFDMATNLPGQDFEPAVAAGGGGELIKRLQTAGIPVYNIRSFQKSVNPLKDLSAFFELYKIYNTFRPTIIHTNSSKAGGIAAVAAFLYRITSGNHVQCVFTVHGWAFLETWRPAWQRYLIRIASTLTCMLSDIVIVISRHDKEAAAQYNIAAESKVTLIPNGIRPASFLPRASAQRELFQNEFPLVLGVIAEWTENKGLAHLIDAMPAILKEFPGVKLCLLGWGDLISNLRFKISDLKLEKNIFLISKNPAAPYLKAFDIFVLPSLKEGLPYTLLEAGLAELPVVAARVGGVPDIIEHKKNGLLVEPSSASQLAEAITRLLYNKRLREKMGKNNKAIVYSKFSLTKMIGNTILCYTISH
jgi:glycosyltransferase involved in cell wall biosynthesis